MLKICNASVSAYDRPMENLNLEERLLYRDGLMLIINKPAGIPVHAGPKGGPNLEHYLHQLQFGLKTMPGLAHRLDRDTSGCLVLGRHPKALRKLGNLFQSGNIGKVYWAITNGLPPEHKGTINLPLAKQSKDTRSWWMKVDEAEGKESITDYEVLGKSGNHAWLACYPRTGRTHQIRVHLAAINCAIVGETIYAGRDLKDTTQPVLHLHSRSISVPISNNKEPVEAVAPPPEHMLSLLKECGFNS